MVARPAFGQSEPPCYDIVELSVRLGRAEHYRLLRAVNYTGIATDTVMVPDRVSVLDRDVPAGAELAAQSAAYTVFRSVEALIVFMLYIEEWHHHLFVTVPRKSGHFRVFVHAARHNIIPDTSSKTI